MSKLFLSLSLHGFLPRIASLKIKGRSMKKSTQDDLFELIHSMDSAERGYFSKYAQRHVLGDRNNYEELYRLILQMPSYDPAALEASLQQKGISTPLAGVKAQLKAILFRAMREYSSHHSTYHALLDGLANLNFLYEKKLYELLRKEIKRLKKTALLYQEHHVLFKIGDFERRLHKETAKKSFVEGMEQILEEMKRYAEDFQSQLDFTHLMDKAYVIAKKADPNKIQELEALLASPLLQEPAAAKTVLSRIYRHQIFAIGHMAKAAYQHSIQEYSAVMQLWDAAPHLIKELPSNYRRVLGNFLGISGEVADFSRYEELIFKIRHSPCFQPAHEVEIFSISYTAELTWRMGTFDWKAVESVMPAIRKGLVDYASALSPATALSLRYNCAIFYFLKEEDAACSKWLRDIMGMARSEQRTDIQRLARVLNLLRLWKHGDASHLEYEYRSTARYFENHGIGRIESMVMEFIHALIFARPNPSSRPHWRRFESHLTEEEVKDLLGALPLRAWAIAQQTGDSPQKVLEQLQ